MITTTNPETRLLELVKYLGDSLEEIENDIAMEKIVRANANLPLNQRAICSNCIHCENNYCIPYSVSVTSNDTCEDCEVVSNDKK